MKLFKELQEEWNNMYGNIGSDFSEIDVFNKFIKIYKNPQTSGAKTSERYFQLLICNLLDNLNLNPMIESHYKLEVDLAHDIIKKCQIDMKVKLPNIILLIELKKNIDLVEKDLFKWFLISKKELMGHKKIQLVWEKENKSKDKTNHPNQYMQLLKYAKNEKWIDDYFYITPDRFTCEVQRLETFFKKTQII